MVQVVVAYYIVIQLFMAVYTIENVGTVKRKLHYCQCSQNRTTCIDLIMVDFKLVVCESAYPLLLGDAWEQN